MIIGAGAVGCHCALQLKKRQPHAQVTVVDKDPYSYDGASSGNMGGFAISEVQPLATVGNLLRAVPWMLNPLAPFTLDPGSLLSLRPWLMNFARSALTPGHFQHVVDAQRSLMLRSHAAHLSVIGGTPLAQLISSDGALAVYKNEKRLRSDWNTRWRLFRESGETCEILSADDLHRRMPDLSETIEHAIYVPEIRFWTSTADLLRGLHRLLHDHDIAVRRAEVVSIDGGDNRVSRLLLQGGEHIDFDQLTIAAGAWSKSLCRDVGDPVPLDSERGYSTTIRDSQVALKNLLLFPDDGFVATPMTDGLRLGGTVELATLETPPNFARTDILATTIADYFPRINTSTRDEWMGNRPSLPDGLPVIGRSPSSSNVCYAFGHGHVGITQSAITGILVAQIMQRETPDVDVRPFRIERFA